MSSNAVTYQINFSTNGEPVFAQINTGLGEVNKSAEKTQKVFGDCYKALLSVNLAADGISVLKQGFDSLIQPGATLNSQMAELSAITGVTGQGLKEIEQAARLTSKTFGTDASANVESYKLVLSQLDPEIAKNSEAMKMMGDNINILSKQMGGDTVAATNVLTTSMNQFGVSTEDPIRAAKVMADMMNVMSSAAQAGSAELPQIQSALEQVGMVAKTTGLSFEETNAQIQILDKAGKKGSEGGVALRNVLTTLSEGRFTSKLAAEGLEAAGISVDYLANNSISLTDRLRTLRKIQGDTALMTKVFGKENMAAAIAMINGADEADKLTQQITGTNSAVEQANTIMGSYTEKMARTKAWVDDLKISFFNLIEPFAPTIQGFFSMFNMAGELSRSYIALKSTLEAFLPKLFIKKGATDSDTISTQINTAATNQNTRAKNRLGIKSIFAALKLRAINAQMTIGAVLARIQASGIRSVAVAFGQATLGATAFQIALDALGIGLILLAIAGLIALFKHLWENSRKFHEILGYIGGVAKAIFHNIGVYAKRVWDMIIKPIAMAYYNVYKWVFLTIWEVIKNVFNWVKSIVLGTWNNVIKPVALWILNLYKTVFMAIWNTVKWVFSTIKNFALGVWNWIKQLFGGFGQWLNETIIEPVRSAFSKIWDWIVGLFDGMKNKLSGILTPIKKFWNKLFSSEGTINVHETGKANSKEAGERFDREQKAKKGDQPQEVKLVEDPKFDVKGGIPKTPTIGGSAVKATQKGSGVGRGNGSDSGNKVRNLSIGKMMDNFNVYMNASNGIDKHQLLQAVREVLLTASADFAGATD
ncbi:phage tail tape measure protein [Riemerella anatipestifer]|uniref:phage tail tape measure protein n=1 Tax=Riemerella anatipestifer TaxID=34085 RepID=UPI0023631F1A|nr:phage tail tape measure protein [Riemerella anatipestifer]MDD1538175.1 phage tail tape measure protein [Riemerella anatipestifer]MDY3402061.1 phage tail tape measure protein [Riemerella anatipestifer]MEE3725111.1 phage tail tape measure protein [Riemerella anatipestifer]